VSKPSTRPLDLGSLVSPKRDQHGALVAILHSHANFALAQSVKTYVRKNSERLYKMSLKELQQHARGFVTTPKENA